MYTIRPEPAPEARAGFTLIEVLVALAIAGIGLAAFLSATGVGLQNVSTADQYIQATRRAQSHLDQVGVSVPLQQGDYTGDDGGGFRWRVSIAAPLAHAPASGNQQASGNEQASGDQKTAALPVLYPVEAAVSWQNGLLRREVMLRSERLGPP